MAGALQNLRELGAAPQKRFSQNFLQSPHWIEKLTEAILTDDKAQEIWEVGPGLGALTTRLVEKSSKPVIAFELDRKLAANLRASLPSLKLNEGDFLEADIARESAGKRVALVSNLPYHLSSPILLKLIADRDKFTRLVLMFQREVAERLRAEPKTKAYGSLSVLTQLAFKVSSLGVIPPGAFYPRPGVDSEALVLTKRNTEFDLSSVEKVARAGFAYRRKKLSSNLKLAFPGFDIEESFSTLGISKDARAEELTPEQFVSLCERLSRSNG